MVNWSLIIHILIPEIPQKKRKRIILQLGGNLSYFRSERCSAFTWVKFWKTQKQKRIKKQTHYIHCTMEYLNKKTCEIRLPCGTKSLQNKYFTQCVLAVINVFQINNKSLFSDKNGENVALSLSGVKSFSLSSLLTMWVFVTNCRFEEFTRLQDMHEGSTVNWERNDQINSRW